MQVVAQVRKTLVYEQAAEQKADVVPVDLVDLELLLVTTEQKETEICMQFFERVFSFYYRHLYTVFRSHKTNTGLFFCF